MEIEKRSRVGRGWGREHGELVWRQFQFCKRRVLEGLVVVVVLPKNVY